MNVHACLADPRRYERQIERLHQKHLGTHRLYELQQSDVSLASFVVNRATVARRIARTVADGAYVMQPAHIRTITVNGKQRLVFAYSLTDLLVHGVVAAVIAEAVAPKLSDCLWSYRPGVSWSDAISGLAAYARQHCASERDVRCRGLYVIRRDVDAYTDSIPVGATSPIWDLLRSLLRSSDDASLTAADWGLIECVVRPQGFVRDGQVFTQYRGVATGQPISCVLFNLYLSGLDARLDRIPGAFYARYCDDLVFAHRDSDVVRAADVCMRDELSARGLRFNERKSRTLYVTAPGRASITWPEARGASGIPLLGCVVSAHGTVALSRPKRRRLLADLEDRAVGTVRALRTRDPAAVGRTVCAAINQALHPRLEFSQQRSAALLRRAVTDRADLKQLDYWIARIVLRVVTGRRGVQAFRQIPYRRMREEWHLLSLCQARNEWPAGGDRRASRRAP